MTIDIYCKICYYTFVTYNIILNKLKERFIKMNTTLKFDKVVLIKELNEKFKQVGEVFEIASILENSFLLRNEKTKDTIGVISFEDFDGFFVHETNYKGWTNWKPLVCSNGQSDAFYRTNRKKTQVKFLTDKVRGESCCCNGDEFNLEFGIQMAYLRCLNKAREKQKFECMDKLSEYEKKLKFINHDIAENHTIMKKMISSLDV